MRLIYSVHGTGRLERAAEGRVEGGAPVVGRVQPRRIAVAVSREAAWGPLWLVLRHDGPCRLTVTPIVGDTVRADLAVVQDFAARPAVTDVTVKVHLSEPVMVAAVEFARRALRSVFFSVRCELESLGGGEVLAFGGLEIGVRAAGWAGGTIPSEV